MQNDGTYATMIVETHFQVRNKIHVLQKSLCEIVNNKYKEVNHGHISASILVVVDFLYLKAPDYVLNQNLIYFQMNYSTGEWKRIKKYRRLEEEVIFSKGGR
jgi:hypothetical protein